MSGNPNPNTTNLPKLPSWSCKRWGQHEHDWLKCFACKQAYEAHLEAEHKGLPGVLHWFSEQLKEATACGSLSKATSPDINGPMTMEVGKTIAGHYYEDATVTCPNCREIADNEGILKKPAVSNRPDPQTREAILDWQKEQSGDD